MKRSAAVAELEAQLATGGGCGAVELRARAEMKRAAPLLFARYMERIGLGL